MTPAHVTVLYGACAVVAIAAMFAALARSYRWQRRAEAAEAEVLRLSQPVAMPRDRRGRFTVRPKGERYVNDRLVRSMAEAGR